MPNTDYYVHKILDHMYGGASFTPPDSSHTFAALLTTLPSTSTGSGLVECSAVWYSRQAITWAAAASRTKTNSAQITFTTNATAAVTDDIEGVAIYDASTSGNLLRVLRSTAHLVVAIGSQVIIPAGQLSLGETWNL